MFYESAAVREVEREMSAFLDGSQMKRLHECLSRVMGVKDLESPDNKALLQDFLNAKTVEGCSPRTIQYYSITLGHFVGFLNAPLHAVGTAEVRNYLASRGESGTVSNVTLDNIRRIISSFFSWLEEEEVIYKSPVRRIKKIRSVMAVKPVISDEEMEVIRDSCENLRDRAVIDLLASTGMR
ncbi:site-specific integrase, partial [Collinsella tanakaei]|uniref:tyrosine-type recombinase/integrase n=1 Tax=Collinsella tanakaei TaxID=626935 RepID=UPI0026EA22C4